MQSKRPLTSLLAAAFLLSALTLSALAQGGGMNRGSQMPPYDPKTEVTLTGTVSDIQQMMMPQGEGPGRGAMMAGMGGMHLTLATKDGSKDVHLGPSSYLTDKNFTINKGDTLEVTGSLVKMMGNMEAFIAREVKKGSETLVLRDKNGMPLWSGYRSR
jgi:hypothetical protein